ncbi:MAG: hypothetical protein JHD16_03330 [Solirubrobacteraceae bacterium]|nr:hypothetical protein [Solirubrobacteraceae bacterium]
MTQTSSPTANRSAVGRPAAPSSVAIFVMLVGERLRERRLSPVIWGLALGAMGAMIVLIWPSIEGSVGELMKSYPKELMEAFGISGFNTVMQYLDGELFGLLVPLAGAVFAVRWVVRPIVGAEDAGQLDTWLAMPLPRRTLAWSTYAAAAIALAAVLTIMWAITMITSVLAGAGVSAGVLAQALVNVMPLSMFFAGVALLASGAMRGANRASGAAIGALFAMYLVDIVGKLAPDYADLRYATAFRYYGSVIENGLNATHVGGLLAAGLLLALLGTELFQRRDV